MATKETKIYIYCIFLHCVRSRFPDRTKSVSIAHAKAVSKCNDDVINPSVIYLLTLVGEVTPGERDAIYPKGLGQVPIPHGCLTKKRPLVCSVTARR